MIYTYLSLPIHPSPLYNPGYYKQTESYKCTICESGTDEIGNLRQHEKQLRPHEETKKSETEETPSRSKGISSRNKKAAEVEVEKVARKNA